MRKTRFCGVVVGFVLALVLVPGALAADKSVVIGLTGDVHSLDPYVLNEDITNAVNDHIFDRLMAPDKDLQPVPALAESWELSEDGLT